MTLPPVPPGAGEHEQYWRARIGEEIAMEREKTKKYYQRLNPEGMTTEQFVRMNIFSLCESIARSKKEEFVAEMDE